MDENPPPPISPEPEPSVASTTETDSAPLPATAGGGAWIGTLVAIYASLAIAQRVAMLTVVTLVRPSMDAVARMLSVDAERRDMPDLGGDVARAVLESWSTFEAPLVIDGVLGLTVLLGVFVASLMLVAGSELGRRAVRLALFADAAVIVGWGLYFSLAIVGQLRTWLVDFERAWVELQRAMGEQTTAQGMAEQIGVSISGGVTWLLIAIHVGIVLVLFVSAGSQVARRWCSIRSGSIRSGSTRTGSD